MEKRESSDPKEDSEDRRWPSWVPHVGRAAKWLIATVLAAAIGVGVTAVLSGGGSANDVKGGSSSDDGGNSPAFPESRRVSSERIGLYKVEENGTSQGALNALGQPSKQERPEGGTCIMVWKEPDLGITFGNLGGANPCLYGSFCSADVGRGWATTKGLEVGESVRR